MPDIIDTCGGFGFGGDRHRPFDRRRARPARTTIRSPRPVFNPPMNINTTMPVGGFLDEALNFGKSVVGIATQYKADVANQKLSVLQGQSMLVQQRAAAEAERIRAAEEAKAKARRPLYIGLGVVAAVGLFLALRKNR